MKFYYNSTTIGELKAVPEAAEDSKEKICYSCRDPMQDLDRPYCKLHPNFCIECIRKYLRVQRDNVNMLNLKCPVYGCTHKVGLKKLALYLEDDDEVKIIKERVYMLKENMNSHMKYCWSCGTSLHTLLNAGSGNKLKCPGCYSEWCQNCNQRAHLGICCQAVLEQLYS